MTFMPMVTARSVALFGSPPAESEADIGDRILAERRLTAARGGDNLAGTGPGRIGISGRCEGDAGGDRRTAALDAVRGRGRGRFVIPAAAAVRSAHRPASVPRRSDKPRCVARSPRLDLADELHCIVGTLAAALIPHGGDAVARIRTEQRTQLLLDEVSYGCDRGDR